MLHEHHISIEWFFKDHVTLRLEKINLSLKRHTHEPLAESHEYDTKVETLKSFEVVVWLVEFYIFRGDVYVAFFNVPLWPWHQTPHGRTKPSRLQLWQYALIRIN